MSASPAVLSTVESPRPRLHLPSTEAPDRSPSRPTLTVVIPALNEEDAIGGTISRCLAARELICERGGLDDVEIIVVSDGSTDHTVEIAEGFDDVKLIVFEQNRGYGAAIKEGFRQGRGDLVSFLDADGTCDPTYFGELCRRMQSESAEIALGSRMGPDSKMPSVRRLGNRCYALLLGLLSGQHITDTASGMRVIRRDALDDLYPLPDGLNFTPSMSARGLLNGLRIVEHPMTYEERVGRSKLNVLRDGVRFLKSILGALVCYRPEQIFLWMLGACLVSMLTLAAAPTEFYWRHGRLEEWMLYRYVACFLLGTFSLSLVLATGLLNRLARFSRRRRGAELFVPGLIGSLFRGPMLAALGFGLTVAAVGFLLPGIMEFASHGTIDLHWSRLLAGAFALLSIAQTAIYVVIVKVADLWLSESAAAA